MFSKASLTKHEMIKKTIIYGCLKVVSRKNFHSSGLRFGDLTTTNRQMS